MSKEITVSVKVDRKLAEEAERVLDKVGLNLSQALALFLRQVVLRRGLPFEVAIPRDDALGEADAVMDSKGFDEVDARIEGFDFR